MRVEIERSPRHFARKYSVGLSHGSVKSILKLELEFRPYNLGQVVYPTRWCSTHTAQKSEHAKIMLSVLVVSSRGDVGWPAGPPDLSILNSFCRVLTRSVQPLSPHPARAMDRIIEEVRRHTLPYVCNRAIKTLENIFNSLSML